MPLFKKGDPTNIDNYRGISLLSLPGEVFATVLKNRLQEWADGLLMEGQCGSQKGLQGCNFQPQGPMRAYRQDRQ